MKVSFAIPLAKPNKLLYYLAMPWNKGKKGYRCFYPKVQAKLPVILRLVEEGLSSKQISKEVCLNVKTISNALERNGYKEMLIKLKENGVIRHDKCATKVSEELLEEINAMSLSGRGIDSIGKKFNIDGTTVRYRLIKLLGKEEYSRRHSKKKYESYWSGRYFTNARGDRLQSGLEELVVDYLFSKGVLYETQAGLVLPEGKFYPDVRLNYDIPKYIEIFGMDDLDFYAKKMEIKKSAYTKNGLRFLSLIKKDFKSDMYKLLIDNFLRDENIVK